MIGWHATPLLLACAASLATFVGGYVTLRHETRLSSILGLTAGMVTGVALFDLLPEALELARGHYDGKLMLVIMSIGLLVYILVVPTSGAAPLRMSPLRAQLAPASLTLHSLLDGLGIGIAFQLSDLTGWLVATAVLTHDIADGVNTVSLSLVANRTTVARRWLLLDALAPVAGVLLGERVHLTPVVFAPLLALFAGFFLYIGLCQLLPRSYALRPSIATSLSSIAGAFVMFLAVRIAG